ncbi:hypothetical protein ALC60_03042 [Trachymyrmex zeteki]|uniref:Uncharacterized protein n=1 Tax=Mycetomoellerius zeteki TaxID=64791 RepID=A0A151XCA1_9HYME|nr:hypothetical protein ALC60_03042 [Trachymyrmex zeteki]
MLHDHVKSIDPGGTERKFATRIAGPDYCNAGRRAAEADGSGTWAPGRPKTKRQNTLRKSLKSLPDERPVIKTKTKGKGRGRDDVSFDLDEEEEEEDEKMEKERMQEKRKRHVEREKRTRSMREMIVYEHEEVYCPWMILSHSEEETLEEQILDCVQEEWEETKVSLAVYEEIEGRGRTLRMRHEDSVAGHGPGPAVVVERFGRPLAVGCQLARGQHGMTVTGTDEPATYSSNGQPVRRNHCHLDNL